MTRLEHIRTMPVEKLAKLIIENKVTDDFCQGDCGDDYDCPHPVECCVRWLKEEVTPDV